MRSTIEDIIISLIQHCEADLLRKVSLKILNSGIILKAIIPESMRSTGLTIPTGFGVVGELCGLYTGLLSSGLVGTISREGLS